jgi:hypothetical protein
MLTHLGWPDGVGLGPWSVLLPKVLGLILPGANFGGLVYHYVRHFITIMFDILSYG